MKSYPIRSDWTEAEVQHLADMPLFSLLQTAQAVHQQYFPIPDVQLSTLLSIKTGGCPEDCQYCPQSIRYETESPKEALLALDAILEKARAAKAQGATRFCMGGAWRSPSPSQVTALCERISAVRELGLETCLTAGMLSESKAQQLKEAGLDYYNHNLDTSERYYKEIISTRTYQDRLDTLAAVRKADLKVCCGGILGMGESPQDRVQFLHTLATLEQHPESVPINQLIPVAGTPLANTAPLDELDFVRYIAIARILMPKSRVRLSAGRENMSPALQTLCFLAGANSIFYGEVLLTQGNPAIQADQALLTKLGLNTALISEPAVEHA